MKIAPLTTFLVLTASVASAAPVASADARIPTWESAPIPAPAPAPAVPVAQPDIIPPHASGPGKPAYADYYNNPNVIKNEGPRQGQQGQKRDAATDGPVHPGLDKRQLPHMPLILADPGRPVHQNLWHEINRADHQAAQKLEKQGVSKRGLPKLQPIPVYDAEGNTYINGVMVDDVSKRGLPKLQPLPVYDAEGNAYLNGVMIKDTSNTKREVKNPPKLEPQPKYDAWGNMAKKPEPKKYGVDAIVPAKPGQNPPWKFAGKGKPSFKEWVETYGYENVPYKTESEDVAEAGQGGEGKSIEARDARGPYGSLIGDVNAKAPLVKEEWETYVGPSRGGPVHPGLDRRQDGDGEVQNVKAKKTCATKHNSSRGLARLHEKLTAKHLEEVEAELKEHGHGDCILTVEQVRETATDSDGRIISQITTQTTAIERPSAATDEVKGDQNASHGLAPLIEQQEAHDEHGANGHAVADHSEHGDGSVHDAVKEAEEAKKAEEKKRKREKRLLLIPQKKDMDKSLWIGVDGVAFKK